MILRVLWRQMTISAQASLAYRANTAIYMFNNVAGPAVALMIWLTVGEQGVSLPFDRGQIVTYFLLQGVVSTVTGTWYAPYLAESIRTGSLSAHLTVPVPYIIYDVGDSIGQKLLMLLLVLPQAALVALLVRADLQLPGDPLTWLLFVVATLLAAALAFLLDVCVGSLAFWLEDVGGIERLGVTVGEFLAGRFVPLAFFPPAVAPLVAALPFRYTLAFPLEVLSGALTPLELLGGFGAQGGYVLLGWLTYRLIWRYGLRAYAAAGA